MKSSRNWEKLKNIFTFTSRTKSATEERRFKVLQDRDYSNSQAFLQWLEMANTTIENNFQDISKLIKEQSDSLIQIKQLKKNLEELITPSDYRWKELQEQISRLAQEIEKKFQQNEEYFQENDFLEKELATLISASFLESRKEAAENSKNQIEQQEVVDLENTLEKKKDDLRNLQKKLEETKALEKEKLIEEWENLKTTINYTNYISPMKNENTNNFKEFLTQIKKRWTEHLDDSKKDENKWINIVNYTLEERTDKSFCFYDYGENLTSNIDFGGKVDSLSLLFDFEEENELLKKNCQKFLEDKKLKDEAKEIKFEFASKETHHITEDTNKGGRFAMVRWDHIDKITIGEEIYSVSEGKIISESSDKSPVKKYYKKGSNQKIIQELLPLLEKTLQSPDSELKTECQNFLDKWENDYSEWIDVGGEKFWIKHYLETWDEPATSELTSEQQQKLDDYDNLKQENEKLKQELERKRNETKMGGLSVTPSQSGRSTPSSTLRKLKLTSGEKEDLMVQEWLDGEYSEKDQVSDIDTTSLNGTKKLVGELEIKDFPALKTINLSGGEGITKLTISDCPQIKSLDIRNNQISEIVGLKNLTELEILNIANNQLKEIKISKNSKLFKLICSRNPLTKIKGMSNTTTLTNFSGGVNPDESKNVVLNLAEEQKNKFIKMMRKGGMEDKELSELSGKSAKEVRKIAESRVQQLHQGFGDLVNEVGFDFANDPDWKDKLVTKLGGKTLAEIPEPNDLSTLLKQQEILKDLEEGIKLALGIEIGEDLADFPNWKDDLIRKNEQMKELQTENEELQVRSEIFEEALKRELGEGDEYIAQILVQQNNH